MAAPSALLYRNQVFLVLGLISAGNPQIDVQTPLSDSPLQGRYRKGSTWEPTCSSDFGPCLRRMCPEQPVMLFGLWRQPKWEQNKALMQMKTYQWAQLNKEKWLFVMETSGGNLELVSASWPPSALQKEKKKKKYIF